MLSYNNTIKKEPNFIKVFSNVQIVLKLWRFWMVLFRSLGILKLVFQALISTVLYYIIKALETIQTSFSWNNTFPKIKLKSFLQKLQWSSLINVDIRNKLTRFQISCEKRLYGDCFHELKTIPSYLLKKSFGTFFKVHSNLSLIKSNLKKLLPV